MEVKEKIRRVRQWLEEKELDALLLTHMVNVRYLSGFTGTAAVLYVTKDRALLLTDFRYTEQARSQCPDWEVIELKNGLDEWLPEAVQEDGCRRVGVEAAHVTVARWRLWEEKLRYRWGSGSPELVAVESPVEELRMIKSDEEIELIQRACVLTDEAFQHILSFLRPGVSEREIALELEFFMRKKGAEGRAFDFIVASGPRSALPHGVASEKKLAAGEAVVLDFGCIYGGYHSDLTRTVFLGPVSAEQQQIYDFIRQVQERVRQEIKPGLTGAQADALARDAIAAAGWGDRFGHSLGHGVGLEIHEKPSLSVRSDTVLRPGMVVTIEPGVYFPGKGGVRIEDTVVITSDGCRTLTTAPREMIIL